MPTNASDYADERVPFIVPFMRNPDFVGREEDLDRLHDALRGEGPVGIRSAVTVPAGLTGMGGIGKTQLAVEYGYRYRETYPGGVFWINAAGPSMALLNGFANLAISLHPRMADETASRLAQAAADYLRRHPGALLVLDNLADLAVLNQPLLPGLVVAALPCRILFTTRRRDLGRFTPIEVTVLPEEPALQLLLRYPSRRDILAPDHPEHAEAQTVCRVLGYLPLALEVASAHLGKRPQASLAAYRRELEKRSPLLVLDDPRARLRSQDLPTRHEAAVAATLASQWEILESEDSRLLLRVAGQLPEAAQIPTARLGLLAGLDEREAGFFGSPLQMALEELENASLVEELRAEQVRLHPLVREFAARQTEEAEAPAFRRCGAANLAAAYENIATLEDHCARRGIDALQQDLITALNLVSPNTQYPVPALQTLLRVLQRESHTLRGWDRQHRPAFLAQQLHNRAVGLRLSGLAEAAATRLAQQGEPHLALRWRAGRESPALERTLAGHAGSVLAVAVTPDGRWAISASSDRTLKVWDLATGQEERTLAGHESLVRSVAVTADGRRAISASDDGTLIVWDLATGQEERTLAGHEGEVWSVAVTPDGRRAISASDDRTLRVWDLSTGQDLATIALEGALWCVALAPDGTTILAGDRAGNVYCLRYVERDS